MGAQLVSTVYVQDPDTKQTVTLDAGTCPEPRLAALVTNPAAWVDGKLPRLPKTAKAESSTDPEGEGSGPSGDGPAADSGDGSATTSDDADSSDGEPKAATATKTAAKKTAAKAPARGRTAAAEGTGGQ